MPYIDVDLENIAERLPLPEGATYTFTLRKAEQEESKDRTSYNIYMELVPVEAPDQVVFHRFSLKPGALSATDPTISIKKFFESVSYPREQWARGFDTEDLVRNISFLGNVRHEMYNGRLQVRLNEVIGQGA